jgi:glyoxylase-like metal-dependent hydrolase (beta-lactamase superfamily II)
LSLLVSPRRAALLIIWVFAAGGASFAAVLERHAPAGFGDGHRVSPSVWLTPGHTSQDLSVIVETANGVVACIHAWWHTDRTPEVDPLAEDQAALETSRQRILATADRVVPGHGEPFEAGRSS